MKHIIIGSGITGLYLAYKLINIKNIHPNDIIIYEKDNRIGGRIYTYQNKIKDLKYSVGAGRLGKKHKYIMKLIKEFNLEKQIIDINKDKRYFINNKLMNEKELLIHHNSKFDSLNKLWKYAIYTKINVNIQNLNLHNYFSLLLNSNEVELLKDSLGYISEMYEMNAYNALLTLRKDFDVENNDFFILKDGIQILCDVLYKNLLDNNVNIIFNSTLNNIDDKQKNIVINNKKINYHKLYLTIKRQDYLNIPYFTKYEKIFNNVSDGHLLRIYAQYKDVWFKDLPKILTQNKLQFIIPINYENGLIQISYTDSYNATFWNNLKNKKEVKMYLKKQLKEMFPDRNIKDPEWITMHYWDAGVHFWKTGINSKNIQQELKDVFSKKNIFILGETYCNRQAWADGALETVDEYLKIN
jgi:hypothetical protein|tara:strand:+ start:19283 stop:20518 length:1236 start_codon:yes stop_codon:yes gene_type:complete